MHFVFVYLKLICVTYILYQVLLMIVMSGVVISYDKVSSNGATSVFFIFNPHFRHFSILPEQMDGYETGSYLLCKL